MMREFFKKIVPILIIILLVSPVHSKKKTDVKDLLILNKKFYIKLLKKPSIKRDNFLKINLSRVIQTRGMIKKIDRKGRYNRKFRIILVDQVAKYLKLNIQYYIYIDDDDSIKILSEKEIFEFSGQLMACTPTNTRRDSYIFDIIFEKGALIVK